ncbi:MAG: undecaprenyl/decaprenyl-phosphate alpha-N-acetylglucosaminyl 1-phosphate transferase [Planctomycetes bacterium]|nr:undecaprenyl/decaprenyl-phosphate alpha-N-acetylglucosaminyl 1-phosphate transferase [Planctomycetota bacterium]
MWLLISGCLLSGCVTSFLATYLMRWLAPRVGLIDKPAARKVHLIPTPLGGGVGIWCGVVLPLATSQLLIWYWQKNPPHWLPEELARHLAGAIYRARELWGIIAAATILAVTGLADDFRPLSWKLRLGLQFGVSIAVVASGVRATVFLDNPWIGAVLSVFWFVVLVNSFNFLDNMDGLSGGIALIVSTIFAVMMLTGSGGPHWFVGGFFLIVAGAVIGFLFHNWSPARIFMGDAGSYFLGFSIACMTILGTFYSPADSNRHVALAPLCVMAVPLYDICSVMLIRLLEGRSLFHPDKRHFSHRLVALGLTRVQAVLTVHLTTLTTGLLGLTLYAVSTWGASLIILACVGCVLLLIAILESAPRDAV